MEQQQKMSLVLSDIIGNASSVSATSVRGKGNEIQQQCRPIPDEFSHQEPLARLFKTPISANPRINMLMPN